MADDSELQTMLRFLDTIGELGAQDRALIQALPLRLRSVEGDVDLVREGDRPSDCCLLIEGMACRYKVLERGQRQILSFHLPGETPDLHSLHLGVMDHSLGALTPGRVAYIPHAALREATQRSASLTALFWRETLIDASIFREWLAGVGRRSAHERVAHLLCELVLRIRVLGLAQGDTVDLPLTQAELADALGLSTVHINRVLQDLRRDRLITLAGQRLTVCDWLGLKDAAAFDPEYLHLRADALAGAD